jgi:hypothetical protein
MREVDSNSFCYRILNSGKVTVLGQSRGALFVVISITYMCASIITINWIKRQESNARQNNEGSAVKSVIFPVFVYLMWANAFVNVYVGIIALLVGFSPYELQAEINNGDYSFVWAFSIMWGLQHAIVEGVAFLLMQKGLGWHAAKVTLLRMFGWFLITTFSKLTVYVTAYRNMPDISIPGE